MNDCVKECANTLVLPSQVPFSEQSVEISVIQIDAPPPGKFKHDLLDCCNVFCKGLFWMALFCTPITEAQLLTRMHLDWCGSHTYYLDEVASTFGTVVTIFVVFFLIGIWFPILLVFFLIYRLVYGTRLRRAYRTKYNVPADCCGDGVEDCCIVYWCTCCSAIQLARQAHDEHKYPYKCCTKTGLPGDALAIV
jgi:Cys-rich protein (TIGR01571 family)